jgi:hypothetical protein
MTLSQGFHLMTYAIFGSTVIILLIRSARLWRAGKRRDAYLLQGCAAFILLLSFGAFNPWHKFF